MTNEEAREILQQIRKQKCVSECDYSCPLYESKTFCLEEEALDLAIKALEAQPCIEDYPTCTECEHYDSEKHYCPRFCQVIKDTLAEAQTCEDDFIKHKKEVLERIAKREHEIDKYIKELEELEQQPSEDTEVIKVSKGAVKARQGRFVIYDVNWFKEHFYSEEMIYGQPKQPSEDCISRQKALDCFEQTNTRQGAKYAIETLPSVIPQRKRGKWIKVYPLGMDYEAYMCSECKTGDWDVTIGEYKFCPYCGAEMSGGGEDADSN